LIERTKIPFIKEKSVVAIHDPIELPKLKLDSNTNIITASIEIYNCLKEKFSKIKLIPTTSLLNYRTHIIEVEKPKLIAISSTQARKNLNKLSLIYERLKNDNIIADKKIGYDIINNYEEFLDRYNIFICTSLKEGGPIPAMDAMKRGCIVLTTPVGQMPELIDGSNGFILNSVEEFVEKIIWIKNNLLWLQQARKNAIKTIKEKRDKTKIQNMIKSYIGELK